MIEAAQHCIVHVGSYLTLHSTARCPAALYVYRHSAHSTDRELYKSGQVSLSLDWAYIKQPGIKWC